MTERLRASVHAFNSIDFQLIYAKHAKCYAHVVLYLLCVSEILHVMLSSRLSYSYHVTMKPGKSFGMRLHVHVHLS